MSNRPHMRMKPLLRSAQADRVSAFTVSVNDLLLFEKYVGMRDAFQRSLDLVRAHGSAAAAAAEIETLLHEVPR